MINWYNLAMNACWILGCAVVLATLSYVSWEAAATKQRFRVQLGRPMAQAFLNLGGLFFCIGLAGTTDIVWQRVLWILLALGFVLQLGVEIYRRKRGSDREEIAS